MPHFLSKSREFKQQNTALRCLDAQRTCNSAKGANAFDVYAYQHYLVFYPGHKACKLLSAVFIHVNYGRWVIGGHSAISAAHSSQNSQTIFAAPAFRIVTTRHRSIIGVDLFFNRYHFWGKFFPKNIPILHWQLFLFWALKNRCTDTLVFPLVQ